MNYITTINDKKYLLDFNRVVGIDEAGRGCWAGPVHVAGFVLSDSKFIKGVNDSKKISKPKREKIFLNLSNSQHCLLSGSVEEINEYGIGRTVERKIQEIIDHFESIFSDGKTFYLVDGQFARNFGARSSKIIRGDSKYYSIAAASIIAKVSRDKFMQSIASQYPDFHFQKHKGYGTKLHSSALNSLGVTNIHRLNYKPIKEILMLKSKLI